MSYKPVILENAEGEEYTVNFPAGWSICSSCQGDGCQVHPALSVWTGSDRDEDPEGYEDMMGGAYDVACAECEGSGKVLEVLERDLLHENFHEDYDLYMANLEAEANYQREVDAEARYFGYYG